MKNIKVLVIMVGLLLTASAVGAVNYPTYKPTTLQTVMIGSTVAQPAENNNSITPMLNEDGTAIQPYAEAPGRAAAGPRRGLFDGDGTTGDGDGKGPLEPGTPIGSVLVLLLLAMGYAALTYLRKRKNLVTE